MTPQNTSARVIDNIKEMEGHEIPSGSALTIGGLPTDRRNVIGQVGDPHPQNSKYRLCLDGEYRKMRYSKRLDSWCYTIKRSEVRRHEAKNANWFPSNKAFEGYILKLKRYPKVRYYPNGIAVRSNEILNPYCQKYDERVHLGMNKRGTTTQSMTLAKKILRKLKGFYYTRVEWGAGDLGSKVRQYEFAIGADKRYSEWCVCHLFVKGQSNHFESKVLKGVPLVHGGHTQRIPLIYPLLHQMDASELQVIGDDLVNMGDVSKPIKLKYTVVSR